MVAPLKLAPRDMSAEPGQGETIGPQHSESEDAQLGPALRDLGKLDEAQLEFLLEQRAYTNRRFSDLAVELGLVSNSDIADARSRLDGLGIESPIVSGRLHETLSRLNDVGSPQGEMLRGVRSQLMLRWFGEDIEQHCLAIVSPDHGDGRSFVCAALGILLAQLDETTLVIDADLRRPRMHELFGLENSEGLSSVLVCPSERPRIQGVAGVPSLHVLTAGPSVPNSHELLTRRQFGLMLEALAARYAFIVIDTPPAATCGEALTIAVRSSGCLMVTRRHRTRLADASELASTLTKHSVEVLGALINEY